MVARKKQFGNVAFGGNWSEEVLVNDELDETLALIETAANDCDERDVEDAELRKAMLYVCKNIEKGQTLSDAFFKALRIQDQKYRQSEAQLILRMIQMWAGRGQL